MIRSRSRIVTLTTVALTFSTSFVAFALPAHAALPSVDMAKVVVASELEPACGQTAKLSDNASTTLVQQALKAKGINTTADGWYGNDTTAAYASWQRKLGYSGIDANGIPGPASLSKLGANRFTITDKIDIGSRNSSYGGKRVNGRTKTMLQAADDLLKNWNFTLEQGSYHPGVGASAGSHDGGGVVDVSVAGLSATQRWEEVKALRTVGFAAWLRTPAEGFPYHIHAVAIGDTDIWQQNGGHIARDQVCDYWRGRNGLASHSADNTPSAYRVDFTWWEKYKGHSSSPQPEPSPLSKGWDTAEAVSASAVECMKGHGYSFAMLYTNIESSHWKTTYSALKDSKMQAVLLQGYVNSAFWTDPGTGTATGKTNVAAAKSVNYPKGADFFLDVEGMKSASRSTVIAWVNNWASQIAAAGYTPGVYSGLPSPLRSSDLSKSVLPKVKVYWKSQSTAAADPAQGYVIKQSLAETGPCGFDLDPDTAEVDNIGNKLVGSGGGSGGGGGGNPPPPVHNPNPYSIGQVCGRGYTVVDSHALSGAKIYLTYNSSNGNNCVATLSTVDKGAVTMNATLAVQGGSSGSDPGKYHWYAGPVTKHAPGTCVKWGGTYGSSSWTSGWSHCG